MPGGLGRMPGSSGARLVLAWCLARSGGSWGRAIRTIGARLQRRLVQFQATIRATVGQVSSRVPRRSELIGSSSIGDDQGTGRREIEEREEREEKEKEFFFIFWVFESQLYTSLGFS